MERTITLEVTLEITATVPEGKENFPLGVFVGEEGDAEIWIRGVDVTEGGITDVYIKDQTLIR